MVVEDLLRGTSAHVGAVVTPTTVVGDEPRVGFNLQLSDGSEVPTVKGRAPALLEHGPLEALAHGVVIGGTGSGNHMTLAGWSATLSSITTKTPQ